MLNTYDIWVNVTALYRYKVPAETREYALEMAREMAQLDVQNNHNVVYDIVDAEADYVKPE